MPVFCREKALSGWSAVSQHLLWLRLQWLLPKFREEVQGLREGGLLVGRWWWWGGHVCHTGWENTVREGGK